MQFSCWKSISRQQGELNCSFDTAHSTISILKLTACVISLDWSYQSCVGFNSCKDIEVCCLEDVCGIEALFVS